MSDIDTRLTRCFRAALPDLPDAEIAAAKIESVPGWDSVALVNLLNLISEEFGIDIEWDRADEMTSFAALREMVAERATNL